jgi:DNA-3-methyladenine glycosylase
MILPQSFFQRGVDEVARDLVGRWLVREALTLRITEVEAYGGGPDTASHGDRGLTSRNAPMFEAGGVAYVYLCYGLHVMVNVVAGPAGEGAAVLIRACEVVHGDAIVARRRGGRVGPAALAGPGRVGAALALDTSWSGHPLFERGALELHDGTPTDRVLRAPRVGIDSASTRDRRALRRYADPDSLHVTRRSAFSGRRAVARVDTRCAER